MTETTHFDTSVITSLIIKRMTHDELAEIAASLCAIANDRIGSGQDAGHLRFWMELLNDWADGVVEEKF